MSNAKSLKRIVFMVILISLTTYLIYFQFSMFNIQYAPEKSILIVDSIYYDLKNPDKKFTMPDELEEISGLTYYKEDLLACIQDEDGILFFYDLNKEKVVRSDKFGKKGDYEGVEIIRDTAYILKSNGHVYYFSINANSIGKTDTIKTNLNSKNDTEGLGFFNNTNEILIACKENSSNKKFKTEQHAIYSIATGQKKFINKPFIKFPNENLKKALEENELDKKNHLPFKPSAVAIHPFTQNSFIVSSVGKLLIELNQKGEIISTIPLKRSVLKQPEGICFNPQGVMYISSEGRDGAGYILQFNPK